MNFFKKRPVITVFFILIITLFLTVYYSFSELKIQLFGYEIKKADLSNIIGNENQYVLIEDTGIENQVDLKTDASHLKVTDSSSQRILLIGDSMVEGLMMPFRDYCEENGHILHPVIWYSSSTKAFGTTDTLKYFIKKYNPTYIVIALGSNELFAKDIRNRGVYINNILKQADTLKLVWIGPPNWKQDTGINDILLKHLGHDRYFLSKELMFDRARDGAHPTRYASRIWVDKITEWISAESRYPIVLNKPGKTSSKMPFAIRMSL